MSDNLSWQEALTRLKEGNARFVDKRLNGQNLANRPDLVHGQDPFAIILSCADSRVVPELAFDTGLGELFVLRVAGNIANTSTIASIEYAVANLNAKLIVVLGHENCGAVTAALAGGDNGHNLNHLVAHITPALTAPDGAEVNAVVKDNARANASGLVDRSNIIATAVENGGTRVLPAYYNLKTGKVDFLDAELA